jgi:hypothetical protein
MMGANGSFVTNFNSAAAGRRLPKGEKNVAEQRRLIIVVGPVRSGADFPRNRPHVGAPPAAFDATYRKKQRP